MSVALRPLGEDEYEPYAEHSVAEYARTLETQAGLPHGHAQRKASTDFAQLWPNGRPDTGHVVYRVVDDASGEAYGYLWLAEREINGRQTIWIYDIQIDDRFRGRGLGREAMRLAEAEALRRGRPRIDFNVFGRNDVARNLYRSLGYEELTVWMGKDLE